MQVAKFPLPYWSNPSSNSIIREMVDNADEDTRAELECLMDGGVIEKQIQEDIYLSQDNLWNFLFFTGYLKNTGERQENNKVYLELSIPNLEIASIYEDSISMWFEKKIGSFDRGPLIKALEDGDINHIVTLKNRYFLFDIKGIHSAEGHAALTGEKIEVSMNFARNMVMEMLRIFVYFGII